MRNSILQVTRLSAMTLFLLAFLNTAYSQREQKYPGKIIGSVIDKESKKGIDYATVSVIYQTRVITGAITKNEGKFIVEGVPPGAFDVKISFLGYDPVIKKDVTLSKTNLTVDLGVIALSPSEVMKNGVVVEAEKDMVTYQIDKKIVNISQDLSAEGGSAVEALRSVPSVDVDVDGNVSLRGSQNFTILVDGKPSPLSASELLKQIPASAIENIEIITNPSVKYSPEGTAGIMNIVMKKREYSGTSGLLNMTVGTRDKYNANALMNHRTNNYSYFLGLSYADNSNHPESKFTNTRDVPNSDSTTTSIPEMERLMNGNNYNLRAGFDYNLNDVHSLSLSSNIGYYGFDRVFPVNETSYFNDGVEKFYKNTSDVFKVGGDYLSFNLSHFAKYETPGQEWSTNLSGSGWDGSVDQSFSQSNADADFNSGALLNKKKIINDVSRRGLRLKSDYTLPIGEKSVLEFGSESDMKYKTTDYKNDSLIIASDQWQRNIELSNETEFIQATSGLYFTYSDTWFDDISFKAGVRGEYYYRDMRQITTDENYDMSMFDFFPSLHMSKPFGKDQLQFSYSRRVQRPDDRLLNPFPDYTDDVLVSVGNPELKPMFTNSFELNYRMALGKSFISLETYYRKTTDLIGQILRVLPDNRILVSTANMNKDSYYGAELAAMVNVGKWLRLNASVNASRYTLEETVENKIDSRTSNLYNANFFAMITPWKGTYIQWNVFYSGERIISMGKQKPMYGTGLSVRQDLIPQSLSVTLSARNLLRSANYEFDKSGPGYSSFGYFNGEGPVLMLTMSYNLNNFRQKRRSGDDANPGGGAPAGGMPGGGV